MQHKRVVSAHQQWLSHPSPRLVAQGVCSLWDENGDAKAKRMHLKQGAGQAGKSEALPGQEKERNSPRGAVPKGAEPFEAWQDWL